MTPQPVWTIVPPVHGDEAMVIAPDGQISFETIGGLFRLTFAVMRSGGRMEVKDTART